MKPEAEIDFKELKVIVGALNESGLVAEKARTVGVSKQKMAEAFVAAIDGLTDEQRAQLGIEFESIANFYNDLIADEMEGGEEGEEIVGEGEDGGDEAPVEQCPIFGTGWDEASEDCKACMEQFAEDYIACKEAVQAANAEPEPEPEPEPAPTVARGRGRRGAAPATVAAAEEKKVEPAPAPATGKKRGQRTTPAAQPAATTPPRQLTPAGTKATTLKQQFELSGLGHRMGTMAGEIDKLLLQPQGTTKKQAVAKLVRDFNRPADKAEAKFLAHIMYLKKKEGVDVKKVGEGEAVKYSVTQG